MHRVHDAYHGDSLSVCALDVGALTISLMTLVRAGFTPLNHIFQIKRADYSGMMKERQV